jgi:glutathione S-transferase
MRYELYYWPTIQGRGEMIRLALEAAGVEYVDVARKRGDKAITKLLGRRSEPHPPFACPVLRDGKRLISHAAVILHHLGPRLGLAPKSEAERLWLHQLQLTITDLIEETHDTHHPVTSWLYYEEQVPSAKRRTQDFWRYRVPKFLGYFENLLAKSGGNYITGRKLTYVDLSLFQIVEGLRYGFPKRMKRFEKKIPHIVALHDRVAKRPRIAAYLASKRRIPFSQWGIWRYYKELDA